jgi:hypothetical protein
MSSLLAFNILPLQQVPASEVSHASLSRAGCLLLSVVSTKAANMMLSEGMASPILI